MISLFRGKPKARAAKKRDGETVALAIDGAPVAVKLRLNPRARREALLFHDRRDVNGTELRAAAGNFLFSTGANEFAGRHTAGHFDIPVMKTTITVDGTVVVKDGVVQDVFG